MCYCFCYCYFYCLLSLLLLVCGWFSAKWEDWPSRNQTGNLQKHCAQCSALWLRKVEDDNYIYKDVMMYSSHVKLDEAVGSNVTEMICWKQQPCTGKANGHFGEADYGFSFEDNSLYIS